MRELKRGSIGLFFVISLLVSIGAVNADIIVNGPDQTAVNIGDDIAISGYVIRDDDVLGLLKFDLVCGGQKNVLMVKSISLKANEKKDFSDHTALKLLLVGEHPEPLETMAILEAFKAEKAGEEERAKLWRKSVA